MITFSKRGAAKIKSKQFLEFGSRTILMRVSRKAVPQISVESFKSSCGNEMFDGTSREWAELAAMYLEEHQEEENQEERRMKKREKVVSTNKQSTFILP